ncbi:MAG TPA: DUF362 domain-containing protein [Myxococcales bacterium]|nr:DUF362 domain-containing protein [Myxococcales bacterium]
MTELKNASPRFDPEKVHVLRDVNPQKQRENFRELLRALVRIKSKETIAIKPNLGSPLPEQTGATTSLWMIEETIRYVRERRGRPILVEAPSHIHDFEQVMEVTGAGKLCRDLDVDYVDARQNTMALRPLKHDDPSGRIYNVHLAVLGADGIICLPKLKTHNRTGVTLGIKGLMGFLAVPDRHGFHRRGVTDDIVELYRRLKGQIRATIIDGTVGMEGHGPTNGRPVQMDLIIGAKDTVSVDSVGAQIMGFDAEEVDHIRIAHDLGLGKKNRRWVVHPEGNPLPFRPFERARSDNGIRTQIITFPFLSAALRMGKMGVRGRTKPIVSPVSACPTCSECATVCPTQAIDPPALMNYEACIGCGLCIPACPENALSSEGSGHKWRRVMRELTGI